MNSGYTRIVGYGHFYFLLFCLYVVNFPQWTSVTFVIRKYTFLRGNIWPAVSV